MCLFRKKIEKKEEPSEKIFSGRKFYDIFCDEMEKKKATCKNRSNKDTGVSKDFYNIFDDSIIVNGTNGKRKLIDQHKI